MKIAVVIVTYNAIQWIENCINSILGSSVHATIIIVDNKSQDNTVNFLKNNFSEKIILIESTENLGFGKGNNLGISMALDLGIDYVFLQNQDVFLQKYTLEKLVYTSQNYKEFGVVSPIHLNGDGSRLEYYFGKYMNEEITPYFYTNHITQNNLKEIYQTDFVNAAAWLIPRVVFENVGGFDPIFWHYGEDNNYIQRVKYHGFKIGVVRDCYILHDSKKRTFENYIYSENYYRDFVKFLQIRYADINKEYNFSKIKSEEKNTLIFDIIIGLLRMDFNRIKANLKKRKILISNLDNIINSREINMKKGKHYL